MIEQKPVDVTLRPCPFCGSSEFIDTGDPLSPIYCRKCLARGADRKRWNTRASPPPTDDEVERVARAMCHRRCLGAVRSVYPNMCERACVGPLAEVLATHGEDARAAIAALRQSSPQGWREALIQDRSAIFDVMRDALADAVTMFDTVEAYTYEDNAREVIRSTASSAAAQIRAELEGSQP